MSALNMHATDFVKGWRRDNATWLAAWRVSTRPDQEPFHQLADHHQQAALVSYSPSKHFDSRGRSAPVLSDQLSFRHTQVQPSRVAV